MSGTKSVRSADPSLVSSTKLVGDVERFLWAVSADVDQEHLDAPWVLKLYPTALEASAYFQSQYRPRSYGPDEVSDRSRRRRASFGRKANASRRAAGRLRRYAVGNRLNRFGTLTYAVACTDPKQVSMDVGTFFRDLRNEIGRPFPYVWVREWHPGGHGLHVHFLVGRFIRQSLIRGGLGSRPRRHQGPGTGPDWVKARRPRLETPHGTWRNTSGKRPMRIAFRECTATKLRRTSSQSRCC